MVLSVREGIWWKRMIILVLCFIVFVDVDVPAELKTESGRNGLQSSGNQVDDYPEK